MPNIRKYITSTALYSGAIGAVMLFALAAPEPLPASENAANEEFSTTAQSPYMRYKYNSNSGMLEWYRTDTDADSISINGICTDLTHTKTLEVPAAGSTNIIVYDEKGCENATNNSVLSQGSLVCGQSESGDMSDLLTRHREAVRAAMESQGFIFEDESGAETETAGMNTGAADEEMPMDMPEESANEEMPMDMSEESAPQATPQNIVIEVEVTTSFSLPASSLSISSPFSARSQANNFGWQKADVGGRSALVYVGEGKDGQRGSCEESSLLEYKFDVAAAGEYLVSIDMTKACDFGECGAADRNNDVFIYSPTSTTLNTPVKYFTSGMTSGEWKDNANGKANNIDSNHKKSKALLNLNAGTNIIAMCGRSDLVAVDKITLIPQNAGTGSAMPSAFSASSFAGGTTQCVFTEGGTVDTTSEDDSVEPESTGMSGMRDPENFGVERDYCGGEADIIDVTRISVPGESETIAASPVNYVNSPVTVMVRREETLCAKDIGGILAMQANIMSPTSESSTVPAFFAGSVGTEACPIESLIGGDDKAMVSEECNCGNLWAMRFTPTVAGSHTVTVNDETITVDVSDDQNPNVKDAAFNSAGILQHTDNSHMRFNSDDGEYFIPAGLFTVDNIWERYLTGSPYSTSDGTLCGYGAYLDAVNSLGFNAYTINIENVALTPARYIAYGNMLDLMYYKGIAAQIMYNGEDEASRRGLMAALNYGAAVQWIMDDAPEANSVIVSDDGALRESAAYEDDLLKNFVIPKLQEGAAGVYLSGEGVALPWDDIPDDILYGFPMIVRELQNGVNCISRTSPGEEITVSECSVDTGECIAVSSDTKKLHVIVDMDTLKVTFDPPPTSTGSCTVWVKQAQE